MTTQFVIDVEIKALIPPISHEEYDMLEESLIGEGCRDAFGDIAVRLRRTKCKYRDLTLRAMRDSHIPTELQKIKEGYARWYFYGWIENNDLDEWMLVDLDKLRVSGLLDNQRMISNYDGTYFIAISREALTGCIVAESRMAVCA